MRSQRVVPIEKADCLSWANVSETPFRLYKSRSHEGGISTPLIMYWKGNTLTPGSITDYPSHLIDIMPTILEIIDADYPESYDNERINPVDGISLLSLTTGLQIRRSNSILGIDFILNFD